MSNRLLQEKKKRAKKKNKNTISIDSGGTCTRRPKTKKVGHLGK